MNSKKENKYDVNENHWNKHLVIKPWHYKDTPRPKPKAFWKQSLNKASWQETNTGTGREIHPKLSYLLATPFWAPITIVTSRKFVFSVYFCLLVLHQEQKVEQKYVLLFSPVSLAHSPTTLPALCQREKVRKMSRFVSPPHLSNSPEGTRWPNKPMWKSQHLHKCFSAKHLPRGLVVKKKYIIK